MYPESLSCDLDIKRFLRSGNTCTFLALGGSRGRYNTAISKALILLPSGEITCISSSVIHLFVQGELISRKCPVVHEYAKASYYSIMFSNTFYVYLLA